MSRGVLRLSLLITTWRSRSKHAQTQTAAVAAAEAAKRGAGSRSEEYGQVVLVLTNTTGHSKLVG
jgi:hypothetical protein